MATFQNRSTAADVSLRTEGLIVNPGAEARCQSGATPESSTVNEIPPTPDVEAARAAEALMELESDLGEPL
jgi:hypothetical protein